LDIKTEKFSIIEIFGRKALFTNGRINRSDLPDGVYSYDIRHSDEGGHACALEAFVLANHFGTVLCMTDFGLQEQHSYIPFEYDTEPNFLGVEATVTEYIANWIEPNEPLPEVTRQPFPNTEDELSEDNTDKYIKILNERILPYIDYDKLSDSYDTAEKEYAKGILKILHDAMAEAYGTDYFDCHGDEEYIVTPAVIQSQKTGAIALALLDLDLSSSGELCGASFFTEYGLIKPFDESVHKEISDKILQRYGSYSYGYTADVSGDIHDGLAAPTKDIKDFLKSYTQYEVSIEVPCLSDTQFDEEDNELER